jgi:hypothetical protein
MTLKQGAALQRFVVIFGQYLGTYGGNAPVWYDRVRTIAILAEL